MHILQKIQQIFWPPLTDQTGTVTLPTKGGKKRKKREKKKKALYVIHID